MDFRYSTEQDDFRASLSGFLRDAAPLAAVREAAGHDPQLWHRLCSQLELPGLHVPLEYGGAGATLLETAIVFSELGRALTPVPLAATAFAIEAVLRTGDEEQRTRLLKGLLCGEQIGAFAVAVLATVIRPRRRCGRTVTAAAPSWTGACGPVLHGHVPTCSSCLRWPTVRSSSTLWRPTIPGSPS